MARDLFSNQGSTTVSSGGTTGPPSQGTTESWTVASSSTFPAASNAASPVTQFYISDPAAPSETILVTNVSGTTWSVTRGADGTTPVLHTAGFTVRNVVSALWLTELEDRVKTITFNVVEYGADPTGAADSSTGVQAAMTAAQTFVTSYGRANVLFPQGKYKLNSTVTCVGGGVTINAYGAYIFAGSNNDLFRDFTAQDATYTLNGSGLTVLGGIWDLKGQNWALSSNATLNAVGFSGFTLSNSSNLTFRDVTIRNVYNYHALDFNTCKNVMIENCRFEGFQNNFTFHADVRLASEAGVNKAITGAVTVDGSAVVTGDRVLLKSQTTASQNGIWVANTAGAWTRPADFNGAGEADRAAVAVFAGSTNATGYPKNIWYQSVSNPTIDTNSQTWAAGTSFNNESRKYSEAIQIDCGSGTPTINVIVRGCYMGPAIDGSGLGGFGKLVGSHTTPSPNYSNITVANSLVDSPTDVGIQAWRWTDSTITGNTIITSANNDAIKVDNGSVGVAVSNNVITQNGVGGVAEYGSGTASGGTASNAHGIRVANTTSACTDCVISGNRIIGNASSSEGIQLQASLRCKVVGNHIYSVGLHGIYVSTVCVDTSVVDNTVIGAGRFDGTTKGSIGVSGSANIGTYIADNTVRKFGSGSEAIGAIAPESSGNPARTVIGINDVGTGWGTGPFDAYNWNNNTNTITLWDVGSIATGATTVSSATLTDIAGLTITNVPAGTWALELFIPVTTVGTVTSTIALKSTGAPTTTTLNFESYRTRSTVGGNATAFNTGITWASALAAGTSVVFGTATIVSTTTGAIQVQFAVSAGTSAQPLAGSTIRLKRTA